MRSGSKGNEQCSGQQMLRGVERSILRRLAGGVYICGSWTWRRACCGMGTGSITEP